MAKARISKPQAKAALVVVVLSDAAAAANDDGGADGSVCCGGPGRRYGGAAANADHRSYPTGRHHFQDDMPTTQARNAKLERPCCCARHSHLLTCTPNNERQRDDALGRETVVAAVIVPSSPANNNQTIATETQLNNSATSCFRSVDRCSATATLERRHEQQRRRRLKHKQASITSRSANYDTKKLFPNSDNKCAPAAKQSIASEQAEDIACSRAKNIGTLSSSSSSSSSCCRCSASDNSANNQQLRSNKLHHQQLDTHQLIVSAKPADCHSPSSFAQLETQSGTSNVSLRSSASSPSLSSPTEPGGAGAASAASLSLPISRASSIETVGSVGSSSSDYSLASSSFAENYLSASFRPFVIEAAPSLSRLNYRRKSSAINEYFEQTFNEKQARNSFRRAKLQTAETNQELQKNRESLLSFTDLSYETETADRDEQQEARQEAEVRPHAANQISSYKSTEQFNDLQLIEHLNEVMDILRQQQILNDNLASLTSITYPNNTLLVDLNKCHRNLIQLWPFQKLNLFNSLKARTIKTFKKQSTGSYKHYEVSQQQASSNSSANESLDSPTTATNRFGRSRYKFRMPDEIMRTSIKLKLDDYDRALSMLTSDIRFKLHLLLYKRIQFIWLLLTTILCIVAPTLIIINLESSLVILSSCMAWLCLQMTGFLITNQFRKKLNLMLEKSVAQANSFFMEHNLMLGVINEGSLLSKAKLIIPMLYFDTSQCREQIESIMSIDSCNDAKTNNDKHILDYSKIDLPPTQPTLMALAQSQLAKKIILRYSQRWISYFDKRKLMFLDDKTKPRHLSTGKCLCQFIEEQFKGEQVGGNRVVSRQLVAEEKAEQVLVKPQVIKLESKFVTASASQRTIPTLSEIVSFKEEAQIQGQQSAATNPNSTEPERAVDIDFNGTIAQSVMGIDKSGKHQASCLVQSDHQACNVSLNQESQRQLPLDAISLEMDQEAIGKGDDLIKKLRLLLEVRKNDLQGIDLQGQLFSSVLCKNQQPPLDYLLSNHTSIAIENNNHDDYANDINNNTIHSTNSSKTKDGNSDNSKKKFFKPEGLFFLTSKKSQHRYNTSAATAAAPTATTTTTTTTNKTHHVLEIC